MENSARSLKRPVRQPTGSDETVEMKRLDSLSQEERASQSMEARVKFCNDVDAMRTSPTGSVVQPRIPAVLTVQDKEYCLEHLQIKGLQFRNKGKTLSQMERAMQQSISAARRRENIRATEEKQALSKNKKEEGEVSKGEVSLTSPAEKASVEKSKDVKTAPNSAVKTEGNVINNIPSDDPTLNYNPMYPVPEYNQDNKSTEYKTNYAVCVRLRELFLRDAEQYYKSKAFAKIDRKYLPDLLKGPPFYMSESEKNSFINYIDESIKTSAETIPPEIIIESPDKKPEEQ